MSKHPSKFTDYLEQLDSRHAPTIASELAAASGAAVNMTGRAIDPFAIASKIVADVRKRLDDVSGRCTVDTLAEGVHAEMVKLEATLPAAVAGMVFNDESEGK